MNNINDDKEINNNTNNEIINLNNIIEELKDDKEKLINEKSILSNIIMNLKKENENLKNEIIEINELDLINTTFSKGNTTSSNK